MVKGGYDPGYQLQLVRDGHRILPWLQMSSPGESTAFDNHLPAIREFRKRNLPLALVSTQWERLLGEAPYYTLPSDDNPNVLPRGGRPLRKLSPFGAERYWYEVGHKWTSQKALILLQQLYPDPPLVEFVSNNEHPKLDWYDLHSDRRYAERNASGTGPLHPDDQREIAAGAWRRLYRALQRGMRDGLINETWRQRARFVGYSANGPATFGKDSSWMLRAHSTRARIDADASYWDGSSYPYYLYNGGYLTADTVWSPQVEAMNWLFMIAEDRAFNPNYLVELSLWDGHTHDGTDRRRTLDAVQAGASLRTYAALARFGIWLMRPTVVREFRYYDEQRSDNLPYTQSIIGIVDQISANPTLQKFWCAGTLVANRTRAHPYSQALPAKYRDADRWFLLNTSADERGEWTLSTRIHVYALALSIGAAPERNWLIYLYATDAGLRQVEVEIPGFRKLRLPVDQSGRYLLVDEQRASVEELAGAAGARGGRALQ